MIFNCIKTGTVPKTMRIGFIVLLWVLLGGWKWWGEENRDIKINHNHHVQKEQLECTDCHEGATSEIKAQLPKEEFCADCHEETEPVADSKQKCLLCHNTETAKLPYREKGHLKVMMGPEPYKDLLFSHKQHAEKEIACATCHDDIAQDDNLLLPRDKYLPSAQQCLNCHVEENVTNTCASCHNQLDTNKAPEDHKRGWERFHSVTANMTTVGNHEDNCLTCHVQNDCASCHSETAPSDHTAFWKLRGHGLVVGADRESCDTCHQQQEFCASCHNETAPVNHVGNWRVRHCPDCHLDTSFTPENNTCAVCHRQAVHYLK